MSDKKIKVYMGIPSLNSRSDVQCYMLRQIEQNYGDKVELVYPKNYCGRIFHDYARNMIVKDFLISDCDVLWFLDSDIAPPPAVIELITNHYDKWKVCGAPYPLFLRPVGHDTPKVVFAVYNDLGKGYNTSGVPSSGTDFVDGIASGCIMIKREILEGMQEPYFEFVYDEKTREMKIGEDIGFCKKVNAMGHRFFIDYAHLCRHFKQIDLLDVNNYVIEEFNQRWAEQDRFMRSQLAELKLGIRQVKAKSSLILP